MNPRVLSLNKSETLKFTALTKKLIKEGKDVVNFAAGEPDFDTPDFIKDAAKKAIDEGFTKYTPSTGMPELKEAISKKLLADNSIDCPAANIIVTAGAKYAIYAALLTMLEDGDEMIMPSPYWVSYPEMAKLLGARSVSLPLKPERNFKIDCADLKKAITARTKLLVLNYPANPVGTTYSKAELMEIWDTVRPTNAFILSDEIYETLTYDALAHTSFASLPGASSRTVTINGFSKSYAMTGWRLGYLAGPGEIIEQCSKVIDHTTSCATSISQKAACAALSNRSWIEQTRTVFEERRNMLYDGLSACKLLKPVNPQGAFYLLCDIRATGLSSDAFATQLLEQYLVSCIPATSFGAEGYVRFSFATANERIAKGIERITSFVAGLKKKP